jgi:hypothetical protein
MCNRIISDVNLVHLEINQPMSNLGAATSTIGAVNDINDDTLYPFPETLYYIKSAYKNVVAYKNMQNH